MKKLIISIIVLVLFVLLIFVFSGNPFSADDGESITPSASASPTESATPAASISPAGNPANNNDGDDGADSGAAVTYTDGGYSPGTVEISKGQKVTFINNSSRNMRTASAVHPTHKNYPGSGIEKCNTSEADDIFDSCEGMTPGNSWSFTFNEVGTWKYHNHQKPSDSGTVVVK